MVTAAPDVERDAVQDRAMSCAGAWEVYLL